MSPDVSRRAALATLGTASLIGVVASSSVGGSNHDGISAGSGGPIRNWGVGLRADRPAEANSHERDVWVAIDGPNSYIGDDGTWHDLNVGGSSNPVPEGHFESVNTDLASIDQVKTKAALSSNQTISDSTVTKINLDTNVTEDNEVITVDLTNNNMTIQKSGTYLMIMQTRWSSSSSWSAGDQIQSRIHVNGSEESTSVSLHPGVIERYFARNTITADLSAGDTVDMRTYQSSGGSRTIDASTATTWLDIARLG